MVKLNIYIVKKFLFFVVIGFSTTIFSQGDRFKLDEKSPIFPNQYVVLMVDSLSAKNAYNKTLEWVSNKYNTSDEIIKAQLKYKFIRIEGSGKLYYAIALGIGNFYDTKYNITFTFMEGKVKFEVTKMTAYFPPTDVTPSRWVDVIYQNKDLYRRNGKLRKSKKKHYNVLFKYFNNLSDNLNEYLIAPPENRVKKR